MGERSRGKHRLTDKQARNAKRPGLLHDGAGLYLQVEAGADDDTPRRSWLLRYQSPTGKRREMGLGSLEKVSLATARDLADVAKAQAGRGIDPIEQRKKDRADAALEAARGITFRQAAEAYVKAHSSSWRNDKHRAQWTATLETYAYPILGALPVAKVDVGLVLRVLEPIWTEKRETASRLRGRLETILDWATVRGYRSGENPARWRGHLQMALPRKSKAVKHHAALPFAQLGAFMEDLRAVDGLGAVALQLCILSATRTTETLSAQWSEFDLDAALWTIPAERMKAHREHRVPLSRQAVKLLRQLRKAAPPKARYVFPSATAKRSAQRPLSNMAMTMTLRRLGRGAITVHGFRSTFRDWAGEHTNFPREVAEAALAHTVKDKVEAAYRRGDALQKRRQLMQAWADYCDRPAAAGSVVALKRKRGDA